MLRDHLNQIVSLKEIETILLNLFHIQPVQAYTVAFNQLSAAIANNESSVLKKFL